MDCLEARVADVHDEQAQAHLQKCSLCLTVLANPAVAARLQEAQAATDGMARVASWTALNAQIQRDEGLLGSLKAWPRRWLVFTLYMAALAAWAVVASRPWNAFSVSEWLTWLLGGAFVAVGLLMTNRDLGTPAPPDPVLWGVGAGAWCLVAVAALAQPEGTSTLLDANFWYGVWGCFRTGVVLFTPIAVLLWFTRRHPMSTAARFAQTSSAAAVGCLALQLTCPSHQWGHCLAGHAGMVFIAGCVGLAWRR